MGFRRFVKDRIKEQISGKLGPRGTPPSAPPGGSKPVPTAPDADGYHAVVRAGSIPVGKGRTVSVDGHNVALFHLADGFFAIDDACAHEDGPLGEGAVASGVVTCPYHDWRFDVRTGACLTEPNRPVSCFATRLVDGLVWVGGRTRDGSTDRGGEHDDGLKTV